MKTKLLIACMGVFAFSVIFFVFPKLKKPEGGKSSRSNPVAKLLSRGEPYVAKPLPSGGAVKLGAELESPLVRVMEREMVSLLETVPSKGNVSDGEMILLLRNVAQLESAQSIQWGQGVDFRFDVELYQAYFKTLDQWFSEGQDHPSLRYAALLAARVMKDNTKRREHAEKGLALLGDADAGWIRLEFLVEMAQFAAPANTRGGWRKKGKAAMPAAFHGAGYADDELGVLSNRLMKKYWEFLKKSERRGVTNQLLSDKNIPPFLVQLANGVTHIDEAWEARGSSFGREVSKMGWSGFNKHLDAARQSLTASWEAHPELPEAAWKMITVSMGRSIEKNEERKWFDRVVAVRFDYQPAYKALTLAIQPRWGGSLDELQDFADECLETGRYDTNVPFQYYTIIRTIMKDSKLDPAIYRNPDVQQAILGIIEKYEREGSYGSSTIRAGKSYAAAAMVYGERYEDAYTLLESIDFVESGFFNTSEMGVKSWKDYRIRAALKGGPAASGYSSMHAMWRSGDFVVAKEAGRQLLKTSNLTAPVKERLEIEMAMMDATAVDSADWQPVFSKGTAVDWAGKFHWQLDDQGRLKGVKALGVGWVPARVSLKEGFELEYKVDYLPGDNAKKSDRSLLFFGRPEWHQYLPVNVRLLYDKNQVTVDRGYQAGDKTAKCSLTRSDSVRVVVKNSQMSVWVNKVLCIENYGIVPDDRYNEPLWVGFGDYWSGSFRNKLRFYDIRVKNYARILVE